VADVTLLSELGSTPHVLEHLQIPVDLGEVLRYLGYPASVPPNAGLQHLLDQWVAEADRRAEPRGVYLVLPVTQLRPRSLRLSSAAGEIEFCGAMGEFLGPAQYVAAFVATAGPNVERLASELMQQKE